MFSLKRPSLTEILYGAQSLEERSSKSVSFLAYEPRTFYRLKKRNFLRLEILFLPVPCKILS